MKPDFSKPKAMRVIALVLILPVGLLACIVWAFAGVVARLLQAGGR